MTLLRNHCAPRRAAYLAILCITFSGTALAQSDKSDDDGDAKPAGAPSDDEPAAKEKAAAPAAPAALPPTTAPANAPADKPAAGDAASGVVIEELPGSAFPEPHVRGIKGGSLWMTMHGLQWPFLPALPGGPSTRIGFSGSAWVDTSYRSVKSGLDTDPSLHDWRQQARLVLRTTPTYSAGDGWFAQAQGELALIPASPANSNEIINADDLYVRLGKWSAFDVTAGRFQGWEVYHFGMGLDLNTLERDGARTDENAPVGIYGVTDLWDRSNGPGHIAFHAYPTDFLRFEVLGEIGSSGLNQFGARPVGILDLGILKVKAGGEYERQTPRPQTEARKDNVVRRGYGGALQLVIDPYIELGVNGAQELVDANNQQGVQDAGRSTTTTSFGGFANGRIVGPLIVGVGADYTKQNNLKFRADPTTMQQIPNTNDVLTHLQLFGAVQYTLWDRFYLKFVLAYANADSNPLSDPPPVGEFRNTMLSGRFRMMYLF